MSVEAIRLRAGKFERKIWRRNLRESIASLIVIISFGYFFVRTDEIALRITWALFIAGTVWVLLQLYRKGRTRKIPAEAGSSSCIDFFRSELERQRDLLKNVWPWYLAPLVPGYVALNVAFVIAHPGKLARLAWLDFFFVAIFVGVWKLNQRAARCLQRSIDDLNANAN